MSLNNRLQRLEHQYKPPSDKGRIVMVSPCPSDHDTLFSTYGLTLEQAADVMTQAREYVGENGLIIEVVLSDEN